MVLLLWWCFNSTPEYSGLVILSVTKEVVVYATGEYCEGGAFGIYILD